MYFVVILLLNLMFTQFGFFRITASAAVDVDQLYSLHNFQRANNNLEDLTANDQLVDSATRKAEAMLESDCWSHYCPPGTSPWDFFNEAEYTYVYAGENLGEGFNDSTSLMNAWMNSPTHRDNIMNKNFNEIGIGYAYGRFQGREDNMIVVVHFGRQVKASDLAPEINITVTSDNPLQILTPKSGDEFKSTPTITGLAPADSDIEILLNQEASGRVKAQGQNFSYRPEAVLGEGDYALSANAYDANVELVATADTVSFKIDQTAPVIDSDSFALTRIIKNDETFYRISVTTSDYAHAVLSSISTNLFDNVGQSQEASVPGVSTWELLVSEESMLDRIELTLYAEDKAGNKTELTLHGSQLQLDSAETIVITPTLEPVEKFSAYLSEISGGNLQASLNSIFLIFLIGIFGIDYMVIHNTGLTGLERSKSHLHLAVLISILIVNILLGVQGTVFTGLTS